MSVNAPEVRRALAARLSFVHGPLHPERLLAELQLDSLDKIELLMVIDELYSVRLSPEDFQEVATVGELADLIAARSAGVQA
jgi:acyl carrier protein